MNWNEGQWDQGFWDAGPTTQTNTKPTKRMKRQAYYPSRAAEQIVWLENLRNKLTAYAATLSLTPAQLAAAIADCRCLIYILGSWLPGQRTWSPSCTAASNAAQVGDGSALIVLPVFTAPALPSGVLMVNTGALHRIFDLVQTIKDGAGYTDAIGADLGIVGSSVSTPDLATVQPVITVTLNGVVIEIGWTWGGDSAFLDMCEIQVDRGTGQGWVLLSFDTTPGYTDSATHPATLTKWKYRAIYHADDQRVGLWSAEVAITVGG